MKLLLVGCGHMGKALLGCFETNPIITNITIVDPAFESSKHQVFRNTKDVRGDFDVLVLAVKPQTYPDIKVGISVAHVISVMAGVMCDQLIADFPSSIVVRLMPNMAAAYGKGMSVLYGAKAAARSMFNLILVNTGLLKWVDEESDLDVLTLFNACGPGLLLGITQEFVAVLQQYGFTQPEAEAMMKQVFIGTSAILEHDKSSLSDLVGSIATKAGITEACLNVLQPGVQPVLEATMKAGLERILAVGE
ncbi:MAG: pyrroline-5-carboxylate reductase dimerization domain-containing protein [Pseudomonadota bacterium]